MNQTTFVPSVIARWNPLDNSPYVFLADEIVKDKWKAYHVGQGMVDVPESVYKATLPLSSEDEQKVVEDFKQFAKIENIIIRKRARYTKLQSVASRLSTPVENLQKEFDKAPEEVQNVIEHMDNETRQKRAYTKRQTAAYKRAQEDSVKAAVVSLQGLGSNATEDQVKAATEELGRKLAEMFAATILNGK